MRYMGGKTRIAAQIGAIMRAGRNGRNTYIEPFIGGGSVAAEMAPEFSTAHLSDANEDLMLLWKAVQDGWIPPTDLPYEEWLALKHATEPSALRAFAGFGVSFGGRWFTSYARNNKGNYYAGASSRTLRRYAPKIAHASLYHRDYAAAGEQVGPDCVVYCDPPYAGTTGYRNTSGFNSAQFWDTAREWSGTGAQVYVSEYAAPRDFVPVWKLRTPVSINRDEAKEQIEQLFIYGPTLDQIRKDRAR